MQDTNGSSESRQSMEAASRGRQRSSSPSLFFRRASSSSLLRFRNRARDDAIQPPGLGARSATSPMKADTSAGDGDDGLEPDAKLLDVLPSFQMYNVLHKHIPRGNVNADQHDLPPSYQESLDPAPGSGASGSASAGSLTPMRPGPFVNLQSVSTQHVNLSSSHIDNEPIQDDLDDQDYDNINIEKLYSLPKMLSPVEIDIRITKHPMKPNEKPEEESILKEYTSGNIINGYVVIENRSSQPLKFEMFYVTLEGYATVIDRLQGKRTVKRFLRMVDLSASWSYSSVDSSTGYDYPYGCKDYENCILGLNNTRILEPGVKYKKVFMFKFPMRLLDVACKHEQYSHCLVPPSFGIDKFKCNGKYSAIRTNPLLCYGHLGNKGSPILTNDLVSETLSINYAVDAKIVGKDPKTGKLNIMRENEYNVRFIPFGFCQPLLGERPPQKQLESLSALIEEKITALENVFRRLENNEMIRNHDIQSTDISGTIDSTFDIDHEGILRCKLRQLRKENRLDEAYSSYPLRNTKNLSSKDCTVESEFSYNIKSKQKKSKKHSLLASFSHDPKNTDKKDNLRSGIIVLSSSIPKDGLPYIQPPLLKKINKFENKNKHEQKNWKALLEPFTETETKILDKLTIRLKCIQSNNSTEHHPPDITSISTELVCLTTRSINSIPVKLDAQLLLSTEKVDSIKELHKKYFEKLKSLQERFDRDFIALNELYNLSRRPDTLRELTFSDFVTPQLMHDIECLANLKVDVRSLSHVFKDQMQTLKNPDAAEIRPGLISSTSSTLLSSTFSGHNSSSNAQQMALFRDQITHEWVQISEREYDRQIDVNLVLSQDIKETLVPTFESCLCSRMYCIKVNIKFEEHAGTASLQIPVRLRMLEA
ncbi:HDL467Cp [Eremothecium sinecaudum]|uniref:HDL467Cp n=1 Tax=Eremothecium sinecaudum TaxID=45286 RepID=A0A0X8HRT5_9SACH|nr:HDL467Cp [Eremothecium sinecaudum]AMD20277.1 HDL467Cp [Eremothecium sinecaudum]